MLCAVFWALVGAFIGWHFPEPSWAKEVKAKVKGLVDKVKALVKKK